MADNFGGLRWRPSGPLFLVLLLVALLLGSRYIASTYIDYKWWSEVGQLDTWFNLLLYGTVPVIIAALLLLGAFWLALQSGVRREFSGVGRRRLSHPLLSRLVLLLLAVLAIIVANATVDNWTAVRFFGGLHVASGQAVYVDPIFGKRLSFYLFGLPFWSMLLRVVVTGAVLSLVIYWVAAHFQSLRAQFTREQRPGAFVLEGISWGGAFDSAFARWLAAILLLGLALHFYFSRFELLYQDHGAFLVGVDWVADHIVLPLQWLTILAAIAGAVSIVVQRARLAWLLLLILPVRYLLPPLINAAYVRPNELNTQRPYIQHHIDATRSAYGLNGRVRETTLAADPEVPLRYEKHKSILDNVRLWDWRAYHDAVSQIQPLRPYAYADSDVDRYDIDGQLRQVLISPRELELDQLGDVRSRWINPHFVYTHGYGAVMAEANRVTADGLPVLFVKNAPAEVTTKSLKLTRPELYFSEVAHEPVFVDTSQSEFNYPSGSQSVYTHYNGTGGFPIDSLATRLAATLVYADPNILLTGNFKPSSRMMIRRQIRERLSTLAGFINWEADPYLVMTKTGQLVWMIDGYMSSNAHPYSRSTELGSGEDLNYMRNSVKATIDAYTGQTRLYVFDPDDILIQAYRSLFPQLFQPASAMPADLRGHTRYPELLFSVQASLYRNFHMRDPESFYNRADLWDLAKTNSKPGEGASPVTPTYMVTSVPGQDQPEFMLITAFTPANKNNLIGVMLARCDGEHLGELVLEELSKQNIIFGPMQIEARISQDQTISKDLSLWNQQGSQVLRGQTLVLPIENSFLYVSPIYIQAAQTSMPQLKKVALAMGNKLAYADTYELALSQLIASLAPEQSATTTAGLPAPLTTSGSPQMAAQPSGETVHALEQVRDHLRRYRELTGQGKWAEAGKELEEIEKLVH